ncbi:MAG TPA: beta-propeller fold lactonase family protein [Roseomonas sp.]
MTDRQAVFYQSVGPELAAWRPDAAAATLTRLSAVTLPVDVQYVWRHPAQRVLYVASSNGGPGGGPNDRHWLHAFAMDPATGALSPHGAPAALPARPIHMSVDHAGAHVLTAYSKPSGVSVHRIAADGTLGEEVRQAVTPDGGIYGHQVLAAPDDATVILVTRGHDAADGKPEEPGALKVFAFRDGQLTLRQTVAPHGGFGFGPRHIDFHPTLPLIYVSLERQNQLTVHGFSDGVVTPEPLFTVETLARRDVPPRQIASTLHVHPDGRHLYLGNRNDAMGDWQGERVALEGGENTLVVYALDPATGRPSLVQRIDSHGFHPRTFSLDPSARMLAVAHITGRRVREGEGTAPRPATISLFRVGADGRLDFARAIPVETGDRLQFWSGMVTL